jgi:hypothetical protein
MRRGGRYEVHANGAKINIGDLTPWDEGRTREEGVEKERQREVGGRIRRRGREKYRGKDKKERKREV